MKNKIIPLALALVLCVSILALNVSAFSGAWNVPFAYFYTPSLITYHTDEGDSFYSSHGQPFVEGTDYTEIWAETSYTIDYYGEIDRGTHDATVSLGVSSLLDDVYLSFPDVYNTFSAGGVGLVSCSVEALYNGETASINGRLSGNYVVISGGSTSLVPFSITQEGYASASFTLATVPENTIAIVDVSLWITGDGTPFDTVNLTSSRFGNSPDTSTWSLSARDSIIPEVEVVNPDIFAWLSSSVQGFLDIPIYGENITFGSVFIILISVPLVVAFLKFFAGG